MKIKVLDFIKRFFENRRGLKKEFPEDAMHPLDSDNRYPFASSLEDKGIYAWQLLFFTDMDNVSKIFDLINRIFKCNADNASGERFLEGEAGKVYLYVSDKSGGKLVSVITKNVELISGLQSSGITPGAPWICFPEIDPDGLGARQGDFEYWWDNFWLPFWGTLNAHEKKRFLYINKAPVRWVEYFKFYEEHLYH